MHVSPKPRGKRREGVALVEAIIAIAMISVLFASVLLFQRVYTAKVEELRAARTQRWVSTAPGGCDQVKSAMTCNEKNQGETDVWAVLAYFGVSVGEGGLAGMMGKAFFGRD